MDEFKKGQRVHVEYDGTFSSDIQGIAWVIPDGRYNASSAPRDALTLAGPEDWPPQVGDIWSANDMEWFVRKNYAREHEGALILVSADAHPSKTTGMFKALNPVLVRRRGQ